MISIKKIVSLMLTLFILCPIASAGDFFGAITQNWHDVLAVGEITEVTQNETVVTVSATIVSENGGGKEQQLQPETMRFKRTDLEYSQHGIGTPALGDYMLVEANRADHPDEDRYKVAFACFRVDSLDTASLTIERAKKYTLYSEAEIAGIEQLVHSGGKDCFFGYNEGNLYLYPDANRDIETGTLIYPIPELATKP